MSDAHSTPKGKKKDDAPTWRTPSKQKRNTREETTPSKKPKIGKMICSVFNVSDVIRSPSAFKDNAYYDWFEFGVTTEKDNKVQRVGCYAPDYRDFLLSEEDLVNNPMKGVEVSGLLVDEDGYTLNSNAQFGNVVELEKPFKVNHCPINSLKDSKYRLAIGDFTSIKVMVVDYSKKTNTKSTVHTYVIQQQNIVMELSAFSKLNLEINLSYTFHDIELCEYKHSKFFRYHSFSLFEKAEVDVVVDKPGESSKQTSSRVKIRSMKKKVVETKCVECNTVITPNLIVDGLYDCPNEETCGVSGFVDEEEDGGFDLTVLNEEGNVVNVMLSKPLFALIGGNKRELLTKKYDITINSDNQIITIVIAE